MKNVSIKRYFLAILILIASISGKAIDITTSGKQFRSDLQTFLSQEGFSPYIDSDGSLCFKQEGNKFWIDVIGEKPYYIQFFREGFSADNANEEAILRAVNHVNTNLRAIKCCYYGEGVSLAVESYCHVSEDFKYVFYKYLSILNLSYDELEKQYNEYNQKTSLPISISSVDMGITDGNNNVVTAYGNTLYSSSTKYLTPRISAYAKSAGTYEIYCKFYDASGTLSTGSNSPSGYSWKYSLRMNQGTGTYTLSGWGSSSAGHWCKGNYRIELYYKGNLLTTKYFTVN